MKSIKVKDLMVSAEDYGVVSEEASLYEAVMALERAQEQFKQMQYKHRSVLVTDSHNHIVGELTQRDVLRSLEPGYSDIGDLRSISRSGLSPDFIKAMLDNYGLWKKPLADICRKAVEIKVKDIMYKPARQEYIEENASLDEAVHQLIIGDRQSLLATGGDRIVGVLRLCDVFSEIYTRTKACVI
jgi:predicted transcriptional regulator